MQCGALCDDSRQASWAARAGTTGFRVHSSCMSATQRVACCISCGTQVMSSELSLRSKTGISGFDDIVCGGLIPSRLYLVDGDPGAGKTTFALQFLLEGVRSGERCLYVTLSETKEELSSGAESHGWTLKGIEVVELVAGADELDGESDLTMLNPSEVELTETTRKVLQ